MIKNKKVNNIVRPVSSGGFTMVELLVSMTLFLAVISIVSLIFVRAIQAQRNTAALIAVNDSMSLSIEQMSREIRTGFDFCNPNCPAREDRVNFLSGRGERIEYAFTGTAITRSINGGPGNPITAEEVEVKSARFIVQGTEIGDGLQPRITLSLTIGSVLPRLMAAGIESRIQTTISPRFIDE